MFRILCLVLFTICPLISSAQENHFTHKINTPEEFVNLAGKPLTHTFAGVSSVKIVYYIGENKLYFINSKEFPLHYNFCKTVLEDTELPDFNNANYSDNPLRKYYLATLNHFRDAQIYTIEFSPADNINTAAVEMVYEAVRNSLFNCRLCVQLSTPALLKNPSWHVPVVRIDDLYAEQKLQIIQKGKSSGRFIAVDADSIKGLHNTKDMILLIHGNTNDIPLCKGIITTSFQTPLSHISILCQNRKTPLVAVKDAGSLKLNELFQKEITFTVSDDTFLLERDTLRLNPQNFPAGKLKKLAIDSINSSIVPLKNLRLNDTKTYGVKAVNLAQLQRVRYKGRKINTPEGAFAIPMFYYFEHLRKHNIDTLIRTLLGNYSSMDFKAVEEALSNIRNAIESAAMNKQLLRSIVKKIELSETSGRFRFRSSSNAEDLEGFNGAGLYTSQTGDSPKSIEKAIKKVWASLWSQRAFDERCHAGIDQESVGMAILAHRSFPDEYVNGVAITRNLYRDFDFGFVVNVQLGDNNLVKPDDNVTCEQFISYFNSTDPFFNEKDAVEYLAFSSLNQNKPLLTREEIFDLTRQLDRIKQRFYRKLKAWKKLPYKDFAMDVEFKAELVNGKKIFYFKQARPF